MPKSCELCGMNKIHDIVPFGAIDFDHAEEEYTVFDYQLNTNEVWLDLIFEQEKVSEDLVPIIRSFIQALPELAKELKRNLTTFQGGEIVNGYVTHHFDECSKEELSSLGINVNQSDQEIQAAMLEQIYLKRVGIYAENEDFAVFDFTLSSEITQYLVVVNVNKEGEINDIVVES